MVILGGLCSSILTARDPSFGLNIGPFLFRALFVWFSDLEPAM